MSSSDATVDFTRFSSGTVATPDALMVALHEQQKLIAQQSEVVEQKSAEIRNQQALIAVLEEQLRLMRQSKYGASSEKNVLQSDWLADEAEALADGEPDADDGELEPDAPSDDTKPKKPRKRRRRGFSTELPRVQEYLYLSDAERDGALDTCRPPKGCRFIMRSSMATWPRCPHSRAHSSVSWRASRFAGSLPLPIGV